MPFDGIKSVDSIVDPIAKVIRYAETRPKNETFLVLQEALRLVEIGWVKRHRASWGFLPVPVKFKYANRFCASAAIYRAAYNLGLTPWNALDLLEMAVGIRVTTWNDMFCNDVAQVAFGFRTAIKHIVPRRLNIQRVGAI